MTDYSPLSETLATLLRSKRIQINDINIVVDNAVKPTDNLVDQAVESILLFDTPTSSPFDLLGASCECVFGELNDSINSDDDELFPDDEEFVSTDAKRLDDKVSSRWEATGNASADKKSSLMVCPVRPQAYSLNSAMKHAKSPYVRTCDSKPLHLRELPSSFKDPKMMDRKVIDILDEALSLSKSSSSPVQSQNRKSILKKQGRKSSQSSITTSPDFQETCRKMNLVF